MQTNLKRINWAFPLMLVLFEFASYLANDMYLPSLPTLAADLHIDQDLAEQTIMVWFFGSASLTLILGPLSDAIGRKGVLITGAVSFFLTSLICGLTDNITIMLIARFFQGMCICTITTAGYGAVHEQFDTKQAIQILSIMGALTIIAPAFGPMFGAIIVQFAHWRVIFYVLAAFGLIATVGLSITMKQTHFTKTPLRAREIARDYWAILKNKAFLIYSLTLSFQFVALIAWIVESVFIIQTTYHRSDLEYGFIQFMVFSQFFVGAQLLRFLIHRMTSIGIIQLSLSISLTAAFLLLAINTFIIEALYPTVFCMMLFALGASLSFGPLNRGAIDACHEPMGRRIAIASFITGVSCVMSTFTVTLINDATLNNLSWMIGVSIIFSVLIWIVGRDACKKIAHAHHIE